MTEEKIAIKGRHLATGLPNTVILTSTDITLAIKDTIDEMVKSIKLILEKTPPELSADIMEQGIVLTGGCSQIKNMDRYISDKIGIPVHIANNPTECVARGVGMALDSIEVLRKAVKTRRR